MKSRSFAISLCAAVVVASSCSVLRKEDPEKNVRSFLTEFQEGLTKTDDEILAFFRVRQTRDAILSVVNILQNQDPFIVCDAAFANANITLHNNQVKVEIPITFKVKDLPSDDKEAYTFEIWLTSKDRGFHITQLDGEGLYQAFARIKNRNEWEADRKLALQERLWIYENARKLEEKFDSVIWYSTYNSQNYFYVVDGSWTNYFLDYDTRHLHNDGINMGLVDSKGDTIVPVAYDLIGAIGFEDEGLVEIIDDGKVGYYDVTKKQLLVEPSFDLIIPYGRDHVWAIVKQDSVYGWLDGQFMYHSGFPSEQIEQWVNKFEFLKQNIRLKPGMHTFCEIPSPEQTGNGLIVPPSYLSKHGIFDEIEGNISTTKVPVNGWTDYKETTGSFLESITEGIRAVVTTVRERYLDGREEFYNSSTLVFVNDKLDTLHVATISGQEVSMHPIDSTLLEVRTPHDYWFGEYEAGDESNLYQHTYFSIGGDKEIIQLKSNRLYPQTQFVLLDSSYLTGNFLVYSTITQKEEPTTFLSVRTLTFMRDEILASYGYTFKDKEKIAQFQQIGSWYTPRFAKVEDFENEMTAIDLYNLRFLNKILDLIQKPLS
jgi:hypothetical protein